ncbi:ATP-binding cassette domain-containing protein [Thalassoglobus polymorphus]|uniref:Putative amino-acid import ATP-binding protein YxeO n=1 Tax=Thalassoglobus polymorphus TaxID=2527994 RepID=A0A517QPA9_9PLAN|nr:ATP-binding cassette domain-containing protein [Thalassoglobus polymorphus]QDT33466.1 putative amino-acid import ATP-binding protein YxeO [Thalassoglobus polymorphus]
MKISAQHQFLPKTNSTRSSMVMDNFGISFEQGLHVIADGLDLPVQSGQIVIFTGESGSGKSSLMKSLRTELERDHQTIVSLDELDLGTEILVDELDLPFEEALQLLSACGLGEAHLLLRTPHELSDGQRYRFRLAKALSSRADWIVADEYTATLDRTLAKVVSLNLRKTADRSATGFLLATTHDDIIDDLSPDIHVHCQLNGTIDVHVAESNGSKKKASRSLMASGFHLAPNPTGRISHGGITAATNSG